MILPVGKGKQLMICTPGRRGGVSVLYENLKPNLEARADYFLMGAREDEQGSMHVVKRAILDYVRFVSALRHHTYASVLINPSIDRKSMVRDAIFLLISNILHVRCVVFFHGWNEGPLAAWDKYFAGVVRQVYSRASSFIVLAAEFKNDLRAIGLVRPIHIVTTAVEDRVFSEAIEQTIRSQLGVVPKEFVVLFLSRIEKTKGIYETLDAFRILHDRMPNTKLVVAGFGSESQSAREYVRCNHILNVEFRGPVYGKEKCGTFLEAHTYILPSYNEGMPVSVLEAMAFGLPVITRPIGGIKDFFEDARMGFVLESLEPKDYAAKLEAILQDTELRKRIAIDNRNYARIHFAASRVAKRIGEICFETECPRMGSISRPGEGSYSQSPEG